VFPGSGDGPRDPRREADDAVRPMPWSRLIYNRTGVW
jgi:hypothetical protein